MALIGSLFINVKGNTTNFNQNMKKASTTAKMFGQTMKRVAKAGLLFGAGLATVVAGGLLLLTKRAFTAIDATAKLAEELGISTEALLGYQLAAGLSGTNTETLNKALLRMVKTVGEAKLGITTGTTALKDFGIKIEELEGLSTQQIFERFSEEISKIKDPTERAAKAALIFGRAGQKLMTFLKLGERGLKDVRREVRALGLDFDAVDAGQVEAANDAMLKLQTIMQGVGNTIAIGLAPFITKASDKMLNFIKVSGGIKQIVRNGIQPLSEGLAKIFDILELVKVGWNFMSVGAKVALAGLLTPVAFLEEKVGDLLRALGQDVPETSAVGDFVEKLLQGATEDIDEMNKALDRFKRGANSTEMTEFFRKIQKEARLASEELKGFAGAGAAASGTRNRRDFLKKKGAKDSKGREFITVDLKNISLKGAGESSGKSTEDQILEENKKSTKFLMAIAAQGVAGRGNARPTAQ